MSKVFFTVVVVFGFCSVSMQTQSSSANRKSSTTIADDRTTFLTGNSKRSWYLYASTPESTIASCQTTSAISLDNNYTFHADGTFEFDHGLITEDPACQQEGCCTDFVNFIGKWEFTNFKKGLRVIALYEKGNPANADKMVLYNATIEQLSESVLKISQVDPETKTRRYFEFHSKE